MIRALYLEATLLLQKLKVTTKQTVNIFDSLAHVLAKTLIRQQELVTSKQFILQESGLNY